MTGFRRQMFPHLSLLKKEEEATEDYYYNKIISSYINEAQSSVGQWQTREIID